MIMSIRTYLNFVAIEDAIRLVELRTDKTQEEIDYVHKFLLPYLSSEYSEYFLSHENNVLFRWERIIRFETLSQRKEIDQSTGVIPKETYMSAKDSWRRFWLERIQKVR